MSDHLSDLLVAATTGGAAPDAPTDRVAEQLLDAALREAAAVGLARVTVEEVVRRAGVARMTAYRRFPRRDDLVAALVQREVGRFLAAVAASIEATDTFSDGVVAAFTGSLAFARAHPMLRRGSEEPGTAFEVVAADDGRLLALGTTFIAHYIQGDHPGEPPRDARWVAEVLARLFLTYLSIPPAAPEYADDAAIETFARTVLAPMAERVAPHPAS